MDIQNTRREWDGWGAEEDGRYGSLRIDSLSCTREKGQLLITLLVDFHFCCFGCCWDYSNITGHVYMTGKEVQSVLRSSRYCYHPSSRNFLPGLLLPCSECSVIWAASSRTRPSQQSATSCFCRRPSGGRRSTGAIPFSFLTQIFAPLSIKSRIGSQGVGDCITAKWSGVLPRESCNHFST